MEVFPEISSAGCNIFECLLADSVAMDLTLRLHHGCAYHLRLLARRGLREFYQVIELTIYD